jgi:methenyltetrahydromethanopterin cyclohydrolase
MGSFSLNALGGAIADDMARASARLRIGVSTGPAGETLVDCGASQTGGIEAGLRLAAVALGGIATIDLIPNGGAARWPWQVVLRSSDPVTACLGSQYAGWQLKDESVGFSAMGSGPARALAAREKILAEVDHQEHADRAVLVVEGEEPPPRAVVQEVAEACGIAPDRLTILYAPTRSLAGSVQVVARVVEVALQKARALKFPLGRVVDAIGSAPLSPPHPDIAIAMGRTNDAIIYGGRVHLFVSGDTETAAELAHDLPSFKSRDYGAPFAEIFRRYKGDFYSIDPMLFSPARVTVTALDHGVSFHAGTISTDLFDASFG